uniref:AcidPPc domain-containing protein n=1 Tax=Syphacia muris TaxID=451379 RepID=A0A0N5AUY3_9BILA
MDPSPKRFDIRPYIFNFILGSAIGALIYFEFFAHPRRIGFYCDDQSIRKPYLPETIPEYMLLSGLGIISAILVCEGIRYFSVKEVYVYKKKLINQIIPNFLKYYGYSIMTFLLTRGTNLAFKFVVGRLRPHFFAVCQPIFDELYCVNNTYIENYECSETDQATIEEARKSFFSGHTSETMAVAVFLVIYLHHRLPVSSYTVLIRHIVQVSLIGISLYTAYTRIIDNMHHLSDIVVGIIAGAIIGILPVSSNSRYKIIWTALEAR